MGCRNDPGWGKAEIMDVKNASKSKCITHCFFYKRLLYKQRYTRFSPKIKQLSTRTENKNH